MIPILIRCIVDESKGFGNFSRSFLVGNELKKRRKNDIFLIDNNQKAKSILREKNFKFYVIPHIKSKKDESKLIIKKMNYLKSPLIILDMSEYGEILSKHITQSGKEVIILDDAWVKNAHSRIIFNGTVVKKFHNYKKIL